MTRRALVLGAGGNAAIAWEIGMIAGMAEEGVDVRNADLFVGTSAGAIVGSQVTAGIALEDLFQQQADPSRQSYESVPPVDFAQWRANLIATKKDAGNITEFLQRVGALALEASIASQSERRKIIERRVPVHGWPGKRFLVVAVDADSGARRAFDRTSDVPFIDAIAASCAVAGIWPAVPIGGRRYIDGGFYSIDNADLAAEYERVVVLTLRARVPPLCVVSLDTAIDKLRRHGARVEVVHPDEAGEAAIASVGGNILDPAVRERAVRAGREQGQRIGRGRVAVLWH